MVWTALARYKLIFLFLNVILIQLNLKFFFSPCSFRECWISMFLVSVNTLLQKLNQNLFLLFRLTLLTLTFREFSGSLSRLKQSCILQTGMSLQHWLGILMKKLEFPLFYVLLLGINISYWNLKKFYDVPKDYFPHFRDQRSNYHLPPFKLNNLFTPEYLILYGNPINFFEFTM